MILMCGILKIGGNMTKLEVLKDNMEPLDFMKFLVSACKTISNSGYEIFEELADDIKEDIRNEDISSVQQWYDEFKKMCKGRIIILKNEIEPNS